KPVKPSDMTTLLGSCPIHKAVVKAVGYGQVPCQEVIATLTGVIATHGQPAVDGVARALLDYEQHGTVLYAKLKPALHVYCRMLLGPMPSEWPTWWQNADGTDRTGKPAVWPPVLPGPPQLTKEEEVLRSLPIGVLAERLHDARLRFIRNRSPKTAKKAYLEVQAILAEYQRREMVPPPEPTYVEPDAGERDRLARVSAEQLANELQTARERYNAFSPGSKAGKEASHQIELLYAEYQR